MYNDCETLVSTRARDTEYFQVGVGLHQGPCFKGALYRIWCGVNRLGDSVVKVV